MTFQEYLLEYFQVTDFDNYWMDYDEGQILYHYANFIASQELDVDAGFIEAAASPEVQEHFYEAMNKAYGEGIPFHAAVEIDGADAFIDFMHTFYVTYAEEGGFLVKETSAPALSDLPATAPAPSVLPTMETTPEPTESVVITSGSTIVVMADSDISFVQLTGVIIFVLAIVAGCLIADALFKRF